MVAGGIAVGAPATIFAPAPTGRCPQLPKRPTFGLEAAARGTQVLLTWTRPAPGPLDIYDGTAQDICQAVKVNVRTVTDRSALVTDLTNGTKYYFWLVDKQLNVVSNMASATIPVTVPGAPAGLTATAGNAQVTLSWAAPASDGGSPVSGYNVYVATSADFKGAAEVPGITGTAIVLVRLTNGNPYYFRVTAVNRVGEGQPSSEALATPMTVPGAPAGLTADAGNAQVTLLCGDHGCFQRESSARQGHWHRRDGDRPGQRDPVLLQGDRGQPGR